MREIRKVLVGGGVRSGKSAYALVRAEQLGERRLFIATAEPFDDEMRERAERHRAERAQAFATVEAPTELVPALRAAYAEVEVVVIDCLTLWLSNLLLAELDKQQVLTRVDELAQEIARAPISVIVVSNEVGLGLVPESPLGRTFRDLSGLSHQALAAVVDELYFAVMGRLLRLSPAPVELVDTRRARA